MTSLQPMEAVAVLYADGREEETRALIDSLSRVVFDEGSDGGGGDSGLVPAGVGRRLLSRLSYQIVRRTTRRTEVNGEPVYRNRLMERSGHPYARALLTSSHQDVEGLVEGGDPMNGPYVMLVPEIRANGNRWDNIFLNSVQARDVQLRFVWETRTAYAEAATRLRAGRQVRLKAIAAGTGLSPVLVYTRLLGEGHDPAALSVAITDRDPASTAKTRRLIAKLPVARDRLAAAPASGAIAVYTEDVFADQDAHAPPNDVLTAVGIFEYFQGHTCTTSERRLGEPETPEPLDAPALASRLAATLAPDGSLIVNTCRPHASVRLLESFGKRFDFRTRHNLADLLAPAGFQPHSLIGSGLVYDIEVYKKALA